jgi:hypothetical protein
MIIARLSNLHVADEQLVLVDTAGPLENLGLLLTPMLQNFVLRSLRVRQKKLECLSTSVYFGLKSLGRLLRPVCRMSRSDLCSTTKCAQIRSHGFTIVLQELAKWVPYPAPHDNVRLGWKNAPWTNALAYFTAAARMRHKKVFYEIDTCGRFHKHFMLVTYDCSRKS